MYKLTDFFQPLNFSNFLIVIGLLIFFDILGSYIKIFFISDEKIRLETRIVDWLIGLSLFIFIWFLTGFVFDATPVNIIISVIVLLIVSLPNYLKKKEYLTLVVSFKQLFAPILLLLPLIPNVLIKASLPPYYGDEMAYHFISPYQVLYSLRYYWTFNGGLYMNTPRLMETLYVLTFSLVHTYSVVRFLQFLILATSILAAYLFIKKLFGGITAFIFTLIFLSLPLDLTVVSTIGYVDIPATCFLLIGLLLGLFFVFYDKYDYLILSAIFWGMSVGTKYTTLIPAVIFIIVILIIHFFTNKKPLKIFNRNVILKIIAGSVIFGGYWYIKNLVAYGNPVYPFFFPCWGKYSVQCLAGSSFFGQWTTIVNSHTFLPIIKEIVPDNIYLQIGLLVVPPFLLIFGNRKLRTTILILTLIFFGEMIMIKYFSGFVYRYQQHLTFVLILSLALIATVKSKFALVNVVKYFLVFVLITSCFVSYNKNVLGSSNTPLERKYYYGEINIKDWINVKFPKVANAVFWCENPPGGRALIARYDPDMIWYGDDALMRSFLLNCDWVDPNLKSNEWQKFLPLAEERKLQFWTITDNKCQPANEIKLKDEIYDSNNKPADFIMLINMRQLNNAIECNSQQVLPNLYYFDYKTINKK